MEESTVSVEPLEEYNALRMIWGERPNNRDVRAAFADIIHYLDGAEGRVDIIVDIRTDPLFPLGATLTGAIAPHSHRMMGTWLVVGGNTVAKFIGATLTSIGRNHIEWFDSEEAAIEYILMTRARA